MCKSRGITLTALSGIGTLRQTAAPSLRIAPDFMIAVVRGFSLRLTLLPSGGMGRYAKLLLLLSLYRKKYRARRCLFNLLFSIVRHYLSERVGRNATAFIYMGIPGSNAILYSIYMNGNKKSNTRQHAAPQRVCIIFIHIYRPFVKPRFNAVVGFMKGLFLYIAP